ILMKAADRFANPTTAPNQLWQTDFTYLKVIGWGWFYLSTLLDDFSRYILAWKLCTTMSATDVSDTLQVALRRSGLNQVKVLHRPRLLSDNGPSYVSSELGKWLEDNGIRHIRGRLYHPMTQGKIERYHRSMKNRILLDNYYLPGQLEQSIAEFVSYYNNCRYHKSLDNRTPADVYFGRGQAILERREKIKRKTIEQFHPELERPLEIPRRPAAECRANIPRPAGARQQKQAFARARSSLQRLAPQASHRLRGPPIRFPLVAAHFRQRNRGRRHSAIGSR